VLGASKRRKNHRPRVREARKFKGSPCQTCLRDGVESLAQADLIALVLGDRRRHRGLAERLEKLCLGTLIDAILTGGPLPDGSPRLHPRDRVRLAAAIELGRRLAYRSNREVLARRSLDAPEAIYDAYAPRLLKERQEVVLMLTVDTRLRLWREHFVAAGTLNQCIVHPRDVFRAAIADNAYGIVLVHNHPSGDATPSPDDRGLTEHLRAVGVQVGIELIDHVIVGWGQFYSFAKGSLTFRDPPQLPRGSQPSSGSGVSYDANG